MKLIDENKYLAELKTYGIYHSAYLHLKEVFDRHLKDLPEKQSESVTSSFPDGYNQCLQDCEDK